MKKFLFVLIIITFTGLVYASNCFRGYFSRPITFENENAYLPNEEGNITFYPDGTFRTSYGDTGNYVIYKDEDTGNFRFTYSVKGQKEENSVEIKKDENFIGIGVIHFHIDYGMFENYFKAMETYDTLEGWTAIDLGIYRGLHDKEWFIQLNSDGTYMEGSGDPSHPDYGPFRGTYTIDYKNKKLKLTCRCGKKKTFKIKGPCKFYGNYDGPMYDTFKKVGKCNVSSSGGSTTGSAIDYLMKTNPNLSKYNSINDVPADELLSSTYDLTGGTYYPVASDSDCIDEDGDGICDEYSSLDGKTGQLYPLILNIDPKYSQDKDNDGIPDYIYWGSIILRSRRQHIAEYILGNLLENFNPDTLMTYLWYTLPVPFANFFSEFSETTNKIPVFIEDKCTIWFYEWFDGSFVKLKFVNQACKEGEARAEQKPTSLSGKYSYKMGNGTKYVLYFDTTGRYIYSFLDNRNLETIKSSGTYTINNGNIGFKPKDQTTGAVEGEVISYCKLKIRGKIYINEKCEEQLNGYFYSDEYFNGNSKLYTYYLFTKPFSYQKVVVKNGVPEAKDGGSYFIRDGQLILTSSNSNGEIISKCKIKINGDLYTNKECKERYDALSHAYTPSFLNRSIIIPYVEFNGKTYLVIFKYYPDPNDIIFYVDTMVPIDMPEAAKDFKSYISIKKKEAYLYMNYIYVPIVDKFYNTIWKIELRNDKVVIILSNIYEVN